MGLKARLLKPDLQIAKQSDSRNALGLATGISVLFFTLVMSFPGTLISLFTTDPELQAYAIPALKMFCLCTPIIGIQMVSSIYFQAIGRGTPALLLGLSRQMIVLLPMILLLSHFYQADGIWAAFPASDFISTLITVSVLVFEMRKLNRKINAPVQQAVAAAAS